VSRSLLLVCHARDRRFAHERNGTSLIHAVHVYVCCVCVCVCVCIAALMSDIRASIDQRKQSAARIKAAQDDMLRAMDILRSTGASTARSGTFVH
jgi:hypothetical protein